MFEMIGTLLTIVIWGAAILIFLGGIGLCIDNFRSGSVWRIITSIAAIILGIYVFFRVYAWTESIAWCLLATGAVVYLVSNFGACETVEAPKKEPGVIEQFATNYVDAYTTKQIIKEATKEAIQETKK